MSGHLLNGLRTTHLQLNDFWSIILRPNEIALNGSQRFAVVLFVQIKTQIWKRMVLERRHSEQQRRRRRRRPGREILRNWEECGEWNLPQCLPPPQIPFHHSLLSLKLPNTDSICNFSVIELITGGSRPKCPIYPAPFESSPSWSPLPPLLHSPYAPCLLLHPRGFRLLLPPPSSFHNFNITLLLCS